MRPEPAAALSWYPYQRALREPNVRANQRRGDSGSHVEKIVEVRRGGHALALLTKVKVRGVVCGGDNLQALVNQGNFGTK